MRALFALAVFLLASLVGVGACNLIEQEVACNRDRDCPNDAGIPFCPKWQNVDAGPGPFFCTNEAEFDGDFIFVDSGVPPQ